MIKKLISLFVFLYTLLICSIDKFKYRRLFVMFVMAMISRFTRFLMTILIIVVLYIILEKYLKFVRVFVENRRIGVINTEVIEFYLGAERMLMRVLEKEEVDLEF